MFDVPGFDVTSMSDDELLNRQSELNRRLVYASRFSGGSEMANQLFALIAAIEGERRDRVLRVAFQMRQSMFPEVIESEPDLVIREKRVVEEVSDPMAERRRQGRQKFAMSITRSATPEGSNSPLPPKKTGGS